MEKKIQGNARDRVIPVDTDDPVEQLELEATGARVWVSLKGNQLGWLRKLAKRYGWSMSQTLREVVRAGMEGRVIEGDTMRGVMGQ